MSFLSHMEIWLLSAKLAVTRAQELWLCQWCSQPCISLGHVQIQGARQNSNAKAANPTRLKPAHPPKLLNNP